MTQNKQSSEARKYPELILSGVIFPRSTRGSQSFINKNRPKKKTRVPNRTTKCASSDKTPPPRFHALARFASVAVVLCSSPGGGGGRTDSVAGCG